MRPADPATDPVGWLRESEADFAAVVRCCPDLARGLAAVIERGLPLAEAALPPRHVGLVADLRDHMRATLDALHPLAPPAPAEGVPVPYRDDGTLAGPPPEPAADPDPGEVCYLFRGFRHPLAEWLRRWEDAMARDHPDVLPGLFYDPDHRDARRQIREDVRFDVAVMRRLTDAEDLGDRRCGGAIKRGKADMARHRRAER